MDKLSEITAEKFVSRLDEHGITMQHQRGGNGTVVLAEKRCSVTTAKVLLSSKAAVELLPPLTVVSANPVLTPDGDILGHGYHDYQGGTLVTADIVIPDVPVAEAVSALKGLHVDFNFVSPGDAARAFAAVISPGMAVGGMFPYPPAPDYAEANESQAGKGFRHEMIREIYALPYKVVAKRIGGVGSLDEDIGTALLDGCLFVTIDNVRGCLNSSFLESALTNPGKHNVRVPHRPAADVDPKPVSFQISSNGLEATPDLANRVSVIRIIKQPPGYKFKTWPEGSLIQHVRANRLYYLGCVYSIIRAWIARGKPSIPCQHDRQLWAGPLNWIVQTLFGTGDLMSGHEAAKRQMGDTGTSWLRQIALRIQEDERFGEVFTASELGELAIDEHIRIPGINDWAERNPLQVARRVGAVLKQVFQGAGVTTHRDPLDGTEDALVLIDRIRIGRVSMKERTTVASGANAGKVVAKPTLLYSFASATPS